MPSKQQREQKANTKENNEYCKNLAYLCRLSTNPGYSSCSRKDPSPTEEINNNIPPLPHRTSYRNLRHALDDAPSLDGENLICLREVMDLFLEQLIKYNKVRLVSSIKSII